MVDRLWVWLGTGVVTAGISAALLAGAGVATATDGDSGDGGGTKTSESADPDGSKNDPGAGVTPGGGLKDDGDKTGDDPAGHQPNVGGIKDELKDDELTDELEDELEDELKDEEVTDETIGDDLIDENITDTDGNAGEIVDTIEQPDLGDAGRSNEGQD